MTSEKKQRKKDRKFHAEEVCWSLTIASDFGFNYKEMIDFTWPSLMEWAEFVDWPEKSGEGKK